MKVIKVIILVNLIFLFFHTFAYPFSYKPKEIVWMDGKEFKINKDTKILVDGEYDIELKRFTQMLKQIADYNDKIINVEVLPFKNNVLKGNIIIGTPRTPSIQKIIEEGGIEIKHEEGYAILIDEKYFLIAIGSRKALHYALSTIEEIFLMSHIKIIGKNIYLAVPCLKLVDYPSLTIRAIHATLFDTLDQVKIKDFIDKASNARFNTIILSINNGMKFNSHPEISKKNAFTKEQIQELIRYAKERHLEVIPMIDLLGHQEWLLAPVYPELILKEGILKDPNMFLTYDPRKTEVYKIIFDILTEIIEIFKPKYIHIGHDEAFGLRAFSEPESYQLFAEHVNRIHDFLSKNGIKTMIWGDMLKKEHNGAEKSIYKAIDLISKDVIIVDWIYPPQEDYPSIRYFTGKGFQVMGATFKNEKAIESYSNFMKNFKPKPLGMVATTWYYLPWGKKEMLYRLIQVSGENFW